jgi:serine O-acetyltransferase
MSSRARLGGVVKEDLVRHGGRIGDPGFLALTNYRFGRWRGELPAGAVRKLLRLPYLLLHRHIRNRHRIELHYTASVGRRVIFSERGDIVIGNRVEIGEECAIGHSVTMGKTSDDARGWPVIGRGVTVGPGAVVVGDIRIGDGARIGANSVVLADVPAGAAVSARPAIPLPADDGDLPASARKLRDDVLASSLPVEGTSAERRARRRRVRVARTAQVGRDLRVARDGNVGIGHQVYLGEDCVLGYGVTVGWCPDREPAQGQATRLGDRVMFAPGSVVLAGVTVGDDATIGPNAVVTSDVPPGATMICPSAGILRPLRPTAA